jgi:hypothetical protein
MSRNTLKQWVCVAFLLPSLLGGDVGKKGGGEAWLPGLPEDFQERDEPRDLSEGPLPEWLSTITEDIAGEHGISARLVKSIIWTESQGDPRKVSPKGAKGLMQLMPVVMQQYKVSDPYDPVTNIRAGVQYFCNLLEEFSGDLPLALAAYNAGPTAVRKYRGIPPFAETQDFVLKVSDLFHAAETKPPIPLLALRMEEAETREKTPERKVFKGSPKLLAFLLKNLYHEAVEVQIQ